MQAEKPLSETPEGCDFTIHNIPFGVFHLKSETPDKARCASAIGTSVIDLAWLESHGHLKGALLDNTKATYFNHPTLNKFMDLTKAHWDEVRHRLQALIREDGEAIKQSLRPLADTVLLLPVKIGDYTDFFSSKNHAYNMGVLFRNPENALPANYLWLPIGYHGRSSSVVVSGTDIHRPQGQVKAPDAEEPTFKPSGRMDYEVELAHFIGGGGNPLGHPLHVDKALDKVFGVVIMNDWSSRDIQNWEYVPLGPFTGKNLGTVISPWIVTLSALEPFKTPVQPLEKNVPKYLHEKDRFSYDIQITCGIQPAGGEETHICTTNYKYMYWTMAQQTAHHTITGCNLQTGDLLGSGTISGTQPNEAGCLIELTKNGKEKFKLSNGAERTFLEDGDTVIMRAWAQKAGVRVGFGECRSAILPPISLDN